MAGRRQITLLKKPRSFLSLILTAGLLAGLAISAVLVAAFYLPGPHQKAHIITLNKGDSLTRASHNLAGAGVVRSALVFRLVVRLKGRAGGLRAGEFAVPEGASMAAIEDILIKGEAVLYPVTVPEGLTSQQIVALLDGLDFLHGSVAIPAEGSVLPETYRVPRGMARQQVIADMQAAQTALIDTLWPTRAANLPLETKQQALILASIVEKETGQAGERGMVAAVFINRLRAGMRLQADPTVIYGLVGGAGTLGRPIRRSELDRETPYNTYQRHGLPPTPIANPGRASLAAVLNPADSDALYFVADGTGGHVFTRSLEQHNRNVGKWRKIEKGARR